MPVEKSMDVQVPGLRELLRDVKNLGKPAEQALRDEAKIIARVRMVPAWTDAALLAGPWAEHMAKRITVRNDRTPSVRIGSTTKDYGRSGKRPMKFRASTNMLRWPSDHGVNTVGPNGAGAQKAFGRGRAWVGQASKHYKKEAMGDYARALARVVHDWNSTREVY